MSAKALLINGSPRPKGNTSIMLNACADVLTASGIETEIVQIGGKNIHGCLACERCRKTLDGTCSIEDVFVDFLLKMKNADIIVTGSPVYFGSATPEMMALLDRAGYVGRPLNYFTRKIGGPITVARRAGQNFTYAQLMYWFMINEFIVPGSTYWNVGFGRGVGEVNNDEEGLKTVRRFAENLVWLAEKLL